MNRTPLRYPGGKSIMTPFFVELIRFNGMSGVSYAEPYAGGAGTAINLLLGNHVNKILINDANICIYSFWKYVVEESDRFIEAVEKVDVNLDSWLRWSSFLKTAKCPSFELGFATFFLSRTNRSGILTAGPIGGRTEEKQKSATYKMDCRFNKTDLIARIREISLRKESIVVSNKDAIEFLNDLTADNNFLVYLDPPYFNQGKSLYLDYYTEKDHMALSKYLSHVVNFKWVLSYDNVPRIREFYKDLDLYEFNLYYTAQCVKQGRELLTHSRNLEMPEKLFIKRSRKDTILRKIDSDGNPSEN